jgi:hypothetical protein
MARITLTGTPDMPRDAASRTRAEQEEAAARAAAAAVEATLARLAGARAQAQRSAAGGGREAAALGVIAVTVLALLAAPTSCTRWRPTVGSWGAAVACRLATLLPLAGGHAAVRRLPE